MVMQEAMAADGLISVVPEAVMPQRPIIQDRK